MNKEYKKDVKRWSKKIYSVTCTKGIKFIDGSHYKHNDPPQPNKKITYARQYALYMDSILTYVEKEKFHKNVLKKFVWEK